MHLDDGFDDGQAQSRTVALALTRGIDSVEAIEQTGQMSGRNLRAGVLNGNHGSIAVNVQKYPHGLTGRGVADGVGYEIAECAPQHQTVAGYAGRSGVGQ